MPTTPPMGGCKKALCTCKYHQNAEWSEGETLQMGNAPSSSVLNQGKGQLSSSDTFDSRPAFPPVRLSAEPEANSKVL